MPQLTKPDHAIISRFTLLCSLALAACSGGAGPQGAPGTPGAPGASGTSCTATTDAKGTTTITCSDGTSATVTSGADGAAGATGATGPGGSSCSVTDNGNGTRTITCGDGTSVIVSSAVADFSQMSAADQADLNPTAVITSITFPADGRPIATVKVSNRFGAALKGLNPTPPSGAQVPAINWRFGLLKLVPGSEAALGVNGSGIDTWVSYLANNATSTASTESAGTSSTTGTLTDNGDGTYSYRFAKVITNAAAAGTTYEADKVHRLVVLIYATNNPFAPMNAVTDFIPANGANISPNSAGDLTGQNDKVDPAACLECHSRLRALPGTNGSIHNGQRYNVRACTACHNDQRRWASGSVGDAAIQADGSWTGKLAVLNGEAIDNLPVFIHKIHMGEDLTLQNGTYTAKQFPEVHYPQDIRNCTKCHRASASGPAVGKKDNWMVANSRACGACHDGVSFAAVVPPGRVAHFGGAWGDDKCSMCHATDLGTGQSLVAERHVAVAPPDPGSVYNGGANGNTNAAWLASAGAVPAGASVISYDVSSVSVDGSNHPRIVFKLIKDGVDVNFGTYNAASNKELIPGFIGSPSAYFVWSQKQDKIAAPADFNYSASGYIRTVWSGSGGTLTGPADVDSTHKNYYTLTLTGTTLSNASMLTGGVGYTYGISNTSLGTQPLTQLGVPGYDVQKATAGTQNGVACTVAAPCDCHVPGTCTITTESKIIGGLIVPAPDKWVVGTGFTARRTIVDNAKCNACHEALGASPTFHAGQRNNGPTCAFCHKPNQTSSGWSASSSSFIHSIHGSAKRTNAFNWHAAVPGKTYAEVTYPGVLNDCEMCHVPGGYDFSNPAAVSAYPNMLYSTVGTGRYDSRPATNPAGYFSISPYVQSDNSVDYGFGYSTSNVSYTLPDGVSGTQDNNGTIVNCTPASPCTCTATAPGICSVPVSDLVMVKGVTVTFKKSGADCNAGNPCTCTSASGQACTAVLATCSAAAPCDAQDSTLVSSPIVAACTGCHDSAMAVDHMQANGGSFYESRGTAFAKPQKEQCLLCHGSGTIASIYDMHMTR